MSAQSAERRKYLNLGCGATFHPHWVNVDFHSAHAEVLAYDLTLGVPFGDDTFELVYHSHVLEHFAPDRALHMLRECYRVLAPGGWVRVVVPDLENICTVYLQTLAEARAGQEGAQDRHEWMLIELMDQMTRRKTGGAMLDYWRRSPLPQEDFLFERAGDELRRALRHLRQQPPAAPSAPSVVPTLDTAFLESGELHQWGYDSLSLERLLRQAGFEQITTQRFDTSGHDDLLTYGLDADATRAVRKPYSLYMEARKVAAELSTPRVALFSSADTGGAGIAARRLHQALRHDQQRSELYVASQRTVTPALHILPTRGPNPVVRQQDRVQHRDYIPFAAVLQKTLHAYPARPARSEYFSIPHCCAPLARVPLAESFDILHLHWVAGMYDPGLDSTSLRGRPVVWTLHDMNPFTGGCHYADGCRRFLDYCGACPQLGSTDDNDLSRQTWKLRMEAYRQLDLHIVCPSAWLAQEARQSRLLGRFSVHHIPNVHPFDVFKPLPRHTVREHLGLAQDALVLLFTAQHVTCARKGGQHLLEVAQALSATPHAEKCVLLVLGNQDGNEFAQTGLRVECLGHMDNEAHLALVYSAADMVLVPSLEDNQPNVICEALGCGTPAVAFDVGGISEMIEHQQTGYLAPAGQAAELCRGVLWLAEHGTPHMRTLCRTRALEQWSQASALPLYQKLYTEIMQPKG